ncbi:MAG: nucleoid occlusion factor SlmA [Methylophilaceae bacterium]|nr:nucleoid occlusion factor SlmA [Methylophilaceae bacterium]
MASKPGERKQQILETLANMLEKPKLEKITTASLAAKLEVSEAALYRHFASKAQMFEGLIEFIEHSLFGLINKITTEETEGLKQVRRMLTVMLLFAEKNPGMTRVLIGDALVNEAESLQLRINQLFDRVESTLKQSLRIAETQTGRVLNPEAQANLLICFVIGRWHQFAKSGFKRKPMEYVQQQMKLLYELEE